MLSCSNRIALLAAFGAGLCGFAADAQVDAAAPDQEASTEVVARVGEESITADELDRFIESLAPPAQPGQPAPTPTPAERAQLLRRLIKVRVWGDLVTEADIEVTDEEVSEALDQFKQARFGGSEQAYEQFLEQANVSEEQLRDELRMRLAPPQYIEQLSEDIEVTEEEAQERYAEVEASGQLDQLKTVDVAHVLVKSDGDDDAVAEEAIRSAYRRITEEGESFAEVAEEVTDDPGSKDSGGKYEGIRKGQFVPAFDELMWDIPIGAISEPFQSEFGWHILKVTERQDDYESLHDRIETLIRRQRVEEKIDAMVEERMEEMDIEILLAGENAGNGVG